MTIIDSPAAMARVLAGSIDPDLRRLLALRRGQLGEGWAAAARFVIADPPDTAAEIEAAIGLPITTDLGGARAGEPHFQPWHDWARRHGAWVELVFSSGDGPADVLLLPDRDDLAPALLALLRQHA